eukprot:PhM_4_TR14156/c1_g1_i1/m.51614
MQKISFDTRTHMPNATASSSASAPPPWFDAPGEFVSAQQLDVGARGSYCRSLHGGVRSSSLCPDLVSRLLSAHGDLPVVVGAYKAVIAAAEVMQRRRAKCRRRPRTARQKEVARAAYCRWSGRSSRFFLWRGAERPDENERESVAISRSSSDLDGNHVPLYELLDVVVLSGVWLCACVLCVVCVLCVLSVACVFLVAVVRPVPVLAPTLRRALLKRHARYMYDPVEMVADRVVQLYPSYEPKCPDGVLDPIPPG